MISYLLPREIDLVEDAGEVVEARVVTMIEGVTGEPGYAPGDYLSNALLAAGVPRPGERLNDTTLRNVRCVQRSPRILAWTEIGGGVKTCQVRVESVFTLWRPIEEAQFPIRGSASLTMIRTALDRDGLPILVEYDGETIRAEIDVLQPQQHEIRELLEATENPRVLANQWINHVNAASWGGGAPREWLCRHVDYECVDTTSSPREYLFRYEFEWNPTGWVYTVAYRDADGNIPADVEEGIGIRDIHWHRERDFSEKFL